MSPSGCSCTLLSPFPPPKPSPSQRSSDADATTFRCAAGAAPLRDFRAHHVAGRALLTNPALMPALAACAWLPTTAADAQQIHALLLKSGLPGSASGVYASTSLARVYLRHGRLGDARKVFDGMPARTVVSWNVLLDGLVRAGDLDAARELFAEMPERSVVSWNTVIAGFARHGRAEEAVELFVEMTSVYGLTPDDLDLGGAHLVM